MTRPGGALKFLVHMVDTCPAKADRDRDRHRVRPVDEHICVKFRIRAPVRDRVREPDTGPPFVRERDTQHRTFDRPIRRWIDHCHDTTAVHEVEHVSRIETHQLRHNRVAITVDHDRHRNRPKRADHQKRRKRDAGLGVNELLACRPNEQCSTHSDHVEKNVADFGITTRHLLNEFGTDRDAHANQHSRWYDVAAFCPPPDEPENQPGDAREPGTVQRVRKRRPEASRSRQLDQLLLLREQQCNQRDASKHRVEPSGTSRIHCVSFLQDQDGVTR